jgi:hypothetical protein
MRYLGAAAAFVAAMTFSLTALGQTHRAVKVGVMITRAGAGLAPQIKRTGDDSANQGGTIYDTIERYGDPKFIISFTEYNPDTCAEVSPGVWSPPSGVNPAKGNIIDFESTGTGMLANGDCPGMTFTFAQILFAWTAHNNKTAFPDNCPLGPPTSCPVTVFNSTWSTPDHVFVEPYEFQITVPVVRPIGEKSAFVGWVGSKGIWTVTLQPPDDDSSFDFTGETVNETFPSDHNSCPGPDDHSTSMATVKNGPPGELGGDRIGWDPCLIEYARCVMKTPCGFQIKQQEEINSPADPPNTFFPYGSAPNDLSATINGSIIGTLADNLPFRAGIGQITSQRSTPLTPNAPVSKEFPSNLNSCFSSLLNFKIFFSLQNTRC